MSTSDISNMCANLTLADVDDEDVSMHVQHAPGEQDDGEGFFYAVCRVVTGKPIRFTFFQETMAAVWRPVMGLTMRQLQPHRFLVRFYLETDIVRVLADGPWTFEQCLLVMQRVPIHGLPPGFRSEVVVAAIGSFLGSLVQTDERNFDGTMRLFYRVRVAIDITKPLKKQMKLKRDNGTWAFVDFRYERLPTFCFLCGVIGHGDRYCSKFNPRAYPKAAKPYGAFMRAGGRRTVPSAGQSWVAPESNSDRLLWRSPAMDSSDTNAQTTDMDKGKGPLQEIVATTTLVPAYDSIPFLPLTNAIPFFSVESYPIVCSENNSSLSSMAFSEPTCLVPSIVVRLQVLAVRDYSVSVALPEKTDQQKPPEKKLVRRSRNLQYVQSCESAPEPSQIWSGVKTQECREGACPPASAAGTVVGQRQ
nr:uncharacterized protein LOC109174453 [Ipomoea trifida]